MKRIGQMLLVLMLLPLTACDEVEELLEQEIDVSLTFAGDLEIVSETAVSEPTDPVNIETELATYRLASDPDVAELLDGGGEITKVKIERIRYSYKDFEGNTDAFVISGGFSFLDVNTMSIRTYPLRDSNINIADADFRNDGFILEDDFSELEEGLTHSSTIVIAYFGRISHNPVDFKVGISVDVTVTVKPPGL